MAKVFDTTVYSDADLVDAFAKAKDAKEIAEAHYNAIKTEFATRDMLVAGETLFGNKYTIKMTSSFPKRVSNDLIAEKMGPTWLDQFKVAKDEPEWRLTVKEITVITSATIEKASAL